MNIDLHCHCAPYSTCATQSIDELLLRAKEGGIRTLSITNHDTTKDEDLFEKKAVAMGFAYIKGAELGASLAEEGLGFPKGAKIHILAHAYKDGDLIESVMQDVKNGSENAKIKRARGEYIAKRFNDLSLSGLTKQRLIACLVEKGHFIDVGAAKEFFRSPEISDGFALHCLGPKETIDLIHKAGGFATWAHPFRGEHHYKFNEDDVKAILTKLIAYGLDGLECFHSSNFEAGAVDLLRALAKQYGLFETIGSDRHHNRPMPYFSFEKSMTASYESEIDIGKIQGGNL